MWHFPTTKHPHVCVYPCTRRQPPTTTDRPIPPSPPTQGPSPAPSPPSPFARHISEALGRVDAAFASELEKGVEGFKAAFCCVGADAGGGDGGFWGVWFGLGCVDDFLFYGPSTFIFFSHRSPTTTPTTHQQTQQQRPLPPRPPWRRRRRSCWRA